MIRALVIAAVVAFAFIASAQSAEPTAQERARELFSRAEELSEQRDYEAALEAFLASHVLHPNVQARNNAAVCLGYLERNPESLDMYDLLFAEFPDLPPEKREKIAA